MTSVRIVCPLRLFGSFAPAVRRVIFSGFYLGLSSGTLTHQLQLLFPGFSFRRVGSKRFGAEHLSHNLPFRDRETK